MENCVTESNSTLQNDTKKYSWAIDCVKAMAVLLVLNNHMGDIYPISKLAFGGALGNALFFAVSGYTWASLKGRSFGSWYTKKLTRIWIPTVITNIIYVLLFTTITQLRVLDYVKIFIYPNKSWFCGAILVYAVMYYWWVKKSNKRTDIIITALLISIYAVFFVFVIDKSFFSLEGTVTGGLCRFLHYFLCMMAGYFYKKNEHFFSRFGSLLLPMSVIVFVASYVGKAIVSKSQFLLNFQFIIQFLNLVCAVLVLAAFRYCEQRKNEFPNDFIRNITKTIAGYSWELYLVQTLIIPLCTRFSFPINLGVVLMGTCFAAWILKESTELLMKIGRGFVGSR